MFEMWDRFQTLVRTIAHLLTPQPVWIESSLAERRSDAIVTAVSDPAFLTQLLDRPKQALASMEI